jgi:hypothetical protein
MHTDPETRSRQLPSDEFPMVKTLRLPLDMRFGGATASAGARGVDTPAAPRMLAARDIRRKPVLS